MSWKYSISSGTLFDLNDQQMAHGYAGHGPGLNNPDMISVHDIGPLPVGHYTIGVPIKDEHVGNFALPLTPDPANQMFGRSAFFIHGDNITLNHTASDGCMIMPLAARIQISSSGDPDLQVYATYDPSSSAR